MGCCSLARSSSRSPACRARSEVHCGVDRRSADATATQRRSRTREEPTPHSPRRCDRRQIQRLPQPDPIAATSLCSPRAAIEQTRSHTRGPALRCSTQRG